MTSVSLSAADTARIAALAKPYLWWPAENGGHALARQIAQIMHVGSYDDILRLEAIAPPGLLEKVMINSAPGWFDDRSWSFWRGRLSFSAPNIPEKRPTRTWARATVL